MNRILPKLMFLLMLPFFGAAQVVDITNASIKHEKADRPCIMVELDATPKALKGAWQDYIKDKYNVKLKGFGFLANKDLLDAEEVQLKAITDKEMNFYTHFDEKKGKTQMCVFASLGYDIYLSPDNYPTEYRSMRRIVDNFVSEYVPTYYKEQVNESEEMLSNLEKEIKNLKDDIAGNEKDIGRNLKEIDKLKKKNIDLSSELEQKEKRLKEVQNLLKEKEKKLQEAKKELQ